MIYGYARVSTDGQSVATQVAALTDAGADKQNGALFATPTAAEGAVVVQIYSVAHFQQNIEQQKLLKGGRNADPFIVARAAVEHRAVVTMELLKPQAAKMPNICQHLGIKCLTLQEFMEEEGWQF